MKCPHCGQLESKVVDSRSVDEGVRRRRECLSCGARFTTYERVLSHNILVVKKDGRREEFSRDKLSSGIRKACEKRPLPTGAIDKLMDTIETALYRLGKAEIPSSVIGDIVMPELEKLDYIAYIRFASVYREFTDIGALKQVVDKLAKGENSAPSTNQLRLLSANAINSFINQKRR
ncbi:MAG: transcriptional repressor NrdR [Dehalococcoidia bacterium]|nr:transcriptional repressor NrdR [Dehalococcoidia bacterium]